MKILDIIGAMAFWGLVVLGVWLLLAATPSQLSGESDRTVRAAEDAGVEYCPRVK